MDFGFLAMFLYCLYPFFRAIKSFGNRRFWKSPRASHPLSLNEWRFSLNYIIYRVTWVNKFSFISFFCKNGQINQVIQEMNAAGNKRIHLLSDFDFEVNPDNEHPTAKSNALTAKLLAPLMRGIAGDPATTGGK
jgi:hypothetical protein